MRGASAIGEALAGERRAPVRVFVVWEPVLAADTRPPAPGVLAPLADRRVTQYWDPERLVSRSLLGGEPAEDMSERVDPVGGQRVLWDWLAVYAPGTTWRGRTPRAEFQGGMVVDVVDELRRRLAAARR
ncbi:MAG: hypothetical protein A2W00_11305 [Candidatus Eisenbacteria bacterium RBG_16_71_46]|nr:MAG: hypothetical protein A2W00_11305 [Candidatus Eisenbacteria bacterium RBG_16_71_46]OGF22824.1 MAG: hypothetical protein A2V63_10615 [Candidatus Eisenbacteria bacterium RBG_19FT_COMBO_70_11]